MMIVRAAIFSILLILPCHASVLWYNGDWNNTTALGNSRSYQFGDAWVYDDFIVPSGGWTITGVFSNDFSTRARCRVQCFGRSAVEFLADLAAYLSEPTQLMPQLRPLGEHRSDGLRIKCWQV
jgi:hypothetical protein